MNAGKLRLRIAICVAAGIFVPAAAQAQSTFRLYAGLAPTNYSIAFDNDITSNFKKGKTVKSSYTAANAGFSWITPIGLYIDLSGQKSPSSATHDLWTSVTTVPQDFSRTDAQLTLGYVRAFNGGATISGFGGFKVGTTTLSAPKPPVAFSTEEFKSQGVFVGVGGGFPLLGGQISVSGGIAFMGGKWTDDTGFSQTADYTLGYSLGGGYTYKFTPALGVTLDARYQQYNYSFNAYSATLPAYEIREKIASVGARLSYQF